MRDVVQVQMPDGQHIWAVVESDRVVDTGVGGVSAKVLTGLLETVRGVATNVRQGLHDARPDEVLVEFGIELATVDSGLVAALVGLNANASVKVTLGWKTDAAGAA
jgi:hypothetical protein